jgi:hypothetical protein
MFYILIPQGLRDTTSFFSKKNIKYIVFFIRPVITADVTQLETIMKNEKIKHAHWVSIDSEYLRFTPVLTRLLLSNEEKAVEKHVKEIQIVFKEIGRDAAE